MGLGVHKVSTTESQEAVSCEELGAMEDDDFVMIRNTQDVHQMDGHNDWLPQIDTFVDGLSSVLWPLNVLIHANPELAFKEYNTRDALTGFLRSQQDWKVTSPVYGLETAWIACHDSGKDGPTVSFNVEMGMQSF